MLEDADTAALPASLLGCLEAQDEASGLAILDGLTSVYLYADDRFLALSPDTRVLGRTYGDVWPEIVEGCACGLTLTVAPLEHEGVLYGLVTAEMRSAQPERRGSAEPRVQESLAAELERTRRSHERTVVLREVALASAGTTDLHSLAAGVLEVFERRLGARQGMMFLSEDGVMYELASFGECKDMHGTRRLRGPSLFAEAVKAGSALTHDDPIPAELLPQMEMMHLADERWVVLPIEASGDILGGLGVTFAGRRPFTEEELSLYEAIEQQLGVALEKVILFEELRETTRLGEALNDINEVLLASLGRLEILERSAHFAHDVLGSDAYAAYETSEDGYTPVVLSGLPEWSLGDRMRPLESSAGLRATSRQEPLVVEDVTRDRRVDGAAFTAAGLTSVLALPLHLRTRRFGLLGFGWNAPHAFTDAEIDFAQKLASAVSLALESARLYENERFIAETLQESLLSLPSEVEGVQIAHLYSSATDTARVGGDFYDVFELAHGNVGVLIGDVSGKGVDAAVLTSLVKNTLRAHSVTPGRTPARIVSLTSQEVHRRTAPESYVTLLFGILDRRDGRFVYCNAAHTSACIRRLGGDMHSLCANSPIVGGFPDAVFADSEAYLDYGDELWLYTDGLTEARVDSVQFGEERLTETLRNSEGDSLDRRVGDLLGEVVRYSQGHLKDDIAMLVLRRVAQPGEALQQKFDHRQLWG